MGLYLITFIKKALIYEGFSSMHFLKFSDPKSASFLGPQPRPRTSKKTLLYIVFLTS